MSRLSRHLVVGLVAVLALVGGSRFFDGPGVRGPAPDPPSERIVAQGPEEAVADPAQAAAPPVVFEESARASESRPENVEGRRAAVPGAGPPRGGTIRVRVVDGVGKAVVGARVSSRRAREGGEQLGGPWMALGYRWRTSRERTDADGALTLERLDPGAYWIAAGNPPDSQYHLAGPAIVTEELGGELELRVVPLPAERLVAGTVLQPDGTPQKGARVQYAWITAIGLQKSVLSFTADDGRFGLLPPANAEAGVLRAWLSSGKWRSTTRTSIDAGTRGLELHLGPPRFVELDVRGPDGVALDFYDASFSYQIGEHRVHADRPRKKRGEPLRWALPGVPFRVDVRASRHAVRRLGPLDPESVGDVLTIELTPDPVVLGKLLADGEPVSGASVELRMHQGVEEDPEGLGTQSEWRSGAGGWTLEDGTFRLVVQRPGWYSVVAWHDELGRGEFGPFQVGAEDLAGIEFELVERPATLRGRVLLPPEHGPEEVWLLPSPGPGFRAVSPDGSYELPGLEPGPCVVYVREAWDDDEVGPRRGGTESEYFHISHGPSDAPDWVPVEVMQPLVLAPGEVREFDIDLATPPACRLRGRLDLGEPIPPRKNWGYGAGPPRFELVHAETGLVVSRADPDAEGNFELGAREPGLYRLELDLGFANGLELTDRVVLGGGTTVWMPALEFGDLELLPPEGEGQPVIAPDAEAVWQGPGELRVRVAAAILDEDTGARTIFGVPAGRVHLMRANTSREDVFVAELTIEAGKTTRFRFPAE